MSEAPKIVPCATCGKQVDAWRAARVRFSSRERFFFCSMAHADEFQFESKALNHPKQENESSSEVDLIRPASESMLPPPLVPSTATDSLATENRETALSPNSAADSSAASQLPDADSLKSNDIESSEMDISKQEPDLRDSLLPLFGEARDESEVSKVHSFEAQLQWAPVLLAALSAGVVAMQGEDFWPLVASAFILALSVAWGQASLRAWKRGCEEKSADLQRRLSGPATRLSSSGPEEVRPEELRPGEEILVLPGQWIPADGTVATGRAQVRLWEGASDDTRVEAGARVAAGAQVCSGQCTIICSKTGKERAFSSLVAKEGARIDEQVQSARIARHLTSRLAPLLALSVAIFVWIAEGSYGQVLGSFAVMWGSLSHPVARALPGLMSRKWLLRAARSGISFAHEQLVDHAGGVTAAIFCARGTVLHGQPEVAELHPLRGTTESEVLSLAAGAESVVHHPVASAVLRAAEVRKVPVDTCRSHNAYPGSGVVCVSSKGDLIVVGSRELLLKERISIAMAEETLRALESRGLTALMLAKNNHLVGVLALQDSLRAGAKASIQLLLDEGIEPILISGDSRTTTEAVAHALAIEHIRPEIAAAERGMEVRSLLDAGSSIAVIGTSPRDDAALGAAPVPIVLEGASIRWRDTSKSHERSIGLVGNQVLTAPLALLIGRRIRHTGHVAWSVSLLPALLGVMSTASQLTPLYTAPLLSSAGAVLAAWLCLRAGPETKNSKSHPSSL